MYWQLAAASNGPLHYAVVLYTTMYWKLEVQAMVLYTMLLYCTQLCTGH